MTVREYINNLNRMIIVGEVDDNAEVCEALFGVTFPAGRPQVDQHGRLIIAD